jgi:hypothetical protein
VALRVVGVSGVLFDPFYRRSRRWRSGRGNGGQRASWGAINGAPAACGRRGAAVARAPRCRTWGLCWHRGREATAHAAGQSASGGRRARAEQSARVRAQRGEARVTDGAARRTATSCACACVTVRPGRAGARPASARARGRGKKGEGEGKRGKEERREEKGKKGKKGKERKKERERKRDWGKKKRKEMGKGKRRRRGREGARRCRSRRQPRPVGHACDIRALREEKGTASALIAESGRARSSDRRVVRGETVVKLGVGRKGLGLRF